MILHPRTASRSIQAVLLDIGFVKQGHRHELDKTIARQILDDGGRVFGTVRNPFDLLVSWWHFECHPGEQTFDDYVRMKLSEGDTHGYMEVGKGPFYGRDWMTDEIRYEGGIEENTRQALRKIGLKITQTFEQIGRSERRPYQEYYDDETRALVEHEWKNDLDRFGYEF